MLVQLLEALEAEKNIGNALRDDLVTRIDSHMRDLATLRAFVIEASAQRETQLEALISGTALAPAAVAEAPKPETPVATGAADASVL